jgi:hypothetical protein
MRAAGAAGGASRARLLRSAAPAPTTRYSSTAAAGSAHASNAECTSATASSASAPDADAGRSGRGCGRVLVWMWPGPGADVAHPRAAGACSRSGPPRRGAHRSPARPTPSAMPTPTGAGARCARTRRRCASRSPRGGGSPAALLTAAHTLGREGAARARFGFSVGGRRLVASRGADAVHGTGPNEAAESKPLRSLLGGEAAATASTGCSHRR